jgi:hypothetical protein
VIGLRRQLLCRVGMGTWELHLPPPPPAAVSLLLSVQQTWDRLVEQLPSGKDRGSVLSALASDLLLHVGARNHRRASLASGVAAIAARFRDAAPHAMATVVTAAALTSTGVKGGTSTVWPDGSGAAGAAAGVVAGPRGRVAAPVDAVAEGQALVAAARREFKERTPTAMDLASR